MTGAASLFRRELLADVLPFPPLLAKGFHDHWLALVAMARGEIAYLDEPLYDYVQHGGAVIGHLGANRRPRPIRRHLIERLRKPTGGSRAVYYYDWHQQLLFCEVLRLRCWERMTPRKRRTLMRLRSADSGVAGLALAARPPGPPALGPQRDARPGALLLLRAAAPPGRLAVHRRPPAPQPRAAARRQHPVRHRPAGTSVAR